jgi:uncharacterized membrane protein
MTWLIGVLIGGALGLAIGGDAWLAGAVIGGVIGWLVGRKTKLEKDDRSGALERRFHELEERLDRFDGRLVKLEAGERPAAKRELPAAPPAGVFRVATEEVLPQEAAPAPVEPLTARAKAVAARRMEPAPAGVAPHTTPKPPSKGLEESAIWRWLTGGNTVVRVGVVVLFFGVAFLLRYAYEHVHVPIELRLSGVAAGAIALLAFGWRLRERRLGYALALQGGGIGVLYLVIFAAFRLYNLLPPGPAFALLVGVAAFSAFVAVVQDARSLAVLGVSGGFLAPILASTGSGSHVMLFSYYAVLNAGILAVAWFKAWRVLNLVGFGFTFAIGTLWGAQLYRPEHFASTEPFLVLFYLFYVAIPLLFARRQAGRLERYVDGTLVFGVPLVAFGLQVGLVRGIEYGAAWSALALGAFYLGLTKAVFGRAGEALRLLAESFLALGVVFATLAIPLALEGRWTSAAWALEGAAIVWIGVRQQRLAARVFGVALQFLAGLAFLSDATRPTGQLAIANSFYLGCLFLALGGLFCAWSLDRRRAGVTRAEQIVAYVLFGWGILWWVFGGLHEIGEHVLRAYRPQAALLFFTGACVAFSWLHTRLDWRAARYAALAQLPLMVPPAAVAVGADAHPLARIGWIAWPLAFGAHFLVLRRHEAAGSRYQYWLHAAGLWLFAALASWEVAWAIDKLVQGKAVWPLIAWALVPGALLALLALRGTRIGWPVAAHRDAYLVAGSALLAVFLALWAFLVNFISNGDPSPLPYVPVLNPLDLAMIGAVLAIALWFVAGRRLSIPAFATASPAPAYALGAAAAFVWVNAVLLRTLHHWAGVPFDLERMLRSDLVQTSFSILWTLIALVTMVFATRRGLRVAWLAGGALLLVVVAKLFVVDLSNVGTIARIVSFIGVGVLMLVVGYFSPVPPKAREEAR